MAAFVRRARPWTRICTPVGQDTLGISFFLQFKVHMNQSQTEFFGVYPSLVCFSPPPPGETIHFVFVENPIFRQTHFFWSAEMATVVQTRRIPSCAGDLLAERYLRWTSFPTGEFGCGNKKSVLGSHVGVVHHPF